MNQTALGDEFLAKRIDEHVGARIRARRASMGLTQEQLAARMGISYQQVQKYETGTNRISAGRLFQIARHLDADIGHFFDGLDASSGRDGPLPHGGRNRTGIELVRNFNGISDHDLRDAISTLVKVIASHAALPSAP